MGTLRQPWMHPKSFNLIGDLGNQRTPAPAPAVGCSACWEVYPKHLDLNPARNQKKKHVSRKEVVAGKFWKTCCCLLLRVVIWKKYDPYTEDLSWKLLGLTIGSCYFCWPSKGNFPVPDLWKLPVFCLKIEQRCGRRSAESSVSLTSNVLVENKRQLWQMAFFLFISFLQYIYIRYI